ncbi:2Fe-2S iron-sulfur cluster-binding protein (plasmid) [Sphingobium sp. SJ10-10]|uniref:2Fe-2S iron-sulfur cluster-binding protein n=1 Tax=Sphingobium sp. SJ10-10 TaxID=3114999 RepID=UPI002E1706E6|nr:2Fe-2S iron-sulfur cluster-binding protein [Sphingobium sp. SJ10-10]
MPQLIITRRNGETLRINTETDGSLMEMIRGGGLDDLPAICGGNCACATCHVHIDPAFAHLFDPMSSDERELLETSAHRTDHSRLSCQLWFRPDVAEVALEIAEED